MTLTFRQDYHISCKSVKLYISYHLQSLKDLTWIVWDKAHIKVFVMFTMEAFKYLFRSSTHIAHFCLWEKMLHRYCPRNIWFGWRSHLNSLWEKANSKVFCHSYFGSLPVHFQRQHSQHIPASEKKTTTCCTDAAREAFDLEACFTTPQTGSILTRKHNFHFHLKKTWT